MQYHSDQSNNTLRNSVIKKGLSILLLYSQIQNKSKLSDQLDPYIYFVSQELKPLQNLIPDSFNLSSDIINPILDDSIQSKDIKVPNGLTSKSVLIVRTVRTNPSDKDILGDWLISKKNAKNIKLVIGVAGYVNDSKKYVKAISVKDFEVIDDKRIRFKSDNEEKYDVSNTNLLDLLKNITGYKTDDSGIKEQVEYIINQTDWKGINPTVYLSHLEYMLYQHNIYQTFEDEFSQKIIEYNARNSNQNSDNLQVVKELNENTPNGQFRIRFRSKKIDSFLSEHFNENRLDISNKENLKMTYESSSYWYEIISDNQHNTINFASVFFLNKASNDTDVIKNFYNYKTAKTPEEMVTPFVADDKKKNGYIITIDELSKNDIKDQESLTRFFTNIFNEIDKDIEFVEKITK